MSEIDTGLNMNIILVIIATVLSCIIIHFIYKNIFGNKKPETGDETSRAMVEPIAPASENTVTESRPTGKSKKRGTWKQKTEFSHPWLLKNLKGHPGNVLMVDFSANGKFMAATCDVWRGAVIAFHNLVAVFRHILVTSLNLLSFSKEK
ncbi:unnamed protein product [Pieris macdunnoughi]|uniref:Uncharacterized protein n=1 Tax=Pieris macdunnoughi TaxID=345717 RepID=A0A821W2Y8_9NEOP|nr:unnamed protein product [Pieris macdunnoughi]